MEADARVSLGGARRRTRRTIGAEEVFPGRFGQLLQSHVVDDEQVQLAVRPVF